MGLIGWIVIGGLAGWLAGLIVTPGDRRGCLINILVGVIGAFVGGLLMNLIGRSGAVDFSFRSLGVAFVGSVVFLLVLQALRGR